MTFKSLLLVLTLHVSSVAGANLCSSSLESYEQLCGEATGNFQLLGSLCFPGGTGDDGRSVVTFTLTFSSVGSVLPLSDLNQYNVEFFDDQDASFPSVNRINDDGSFQNCSHREDFRKGVYHVVSAKNKTVNGDLTTYTHSVTVSEVYAREWYFVLSACGISSPVKLHSYSISSDAAVECAEIYAQNDAGYIAAIVILALVCVVLAVVSFIFYKRTKIPELLSMVRLVGECVSRECVGGGIYRACLSMLHLNCA